jgi:hypothetical protein
MPVISMFYGIIIRMHFMNTKQHKPPHFHAEYSCKMCRASKSRVSSQAPWNGPAKLI